MSGPFPEISYHYFGFHIQLYITFPMNLPFPLLSASFSPLGGSGVLKGVDFVADGNDGIG